MYPVLTDDHKQLTQAQVDLHTRARGCHNQAPRHGVLLRVRK